ncbi:hypothetical protein [Thermomonospora umbrina]|uniref:Uncharacterized protein n=1 Tax=Thermomonospora umbrina TaxID=111806 RepID=A0A3D9SQ28_9ACTN|nr:hypothetical protein [Thermomonospora umbrina]REE96580.1 hypothetical protein DFJ69_2019 [Thermomonospora umbrina]
MGNYPYPEELNKHGISRDEFNNLDPEWQQWYYLQYNGEATRPQDTHYPRGTAPHGDFKWEAGDGFEVKPQKLRDLADALETDLNTLKPLVSKISQEGLITTQHVGDWASSKEFAQAAANAHSGFGQYLNDIIAGYTGVIQRLRTTADNYENANTTTNNQVNNVPTPNGGGNVRL